MTTESDIHAWIETITRDWDQQCQALMWQLANRFGTVVSTPPSAIDAFRTEQRAGRVGSGPAPAGSYVYFDIGSYGHVGFVMNDGRVFMTGRPNGRTVEQWGNWNVGWNTAEGYASNSGARILGWSWQNGGNSVPFEIDGSRQPEPKRKGHPDMFAIQRVANEAIYTFGQEYVKHETNLARATATMQAFNPSGDWLRCDDETISAFCDSLGIPWDAVERVTAQPGGVWSKARDIESAIAAEPAPAPEPQPEPEPGGGRPGRPGRGNRP